MIHCVFLPEITKKPLTMQQKVFKSGTPRVPYLMNQIAASYIKLGKPINAIEWANKGIALSKEKR